MPHGYNQLDCRSAEQFVVSRMQQKNIMLSTLNVDANISAI
jgi:hypothetical protein